MSTRAKTVRAAFDRLIAGLTDEASDLVDGALAGGRSASDADREYLRCLADEAAYIARTRDYVAMHYCLPIEVVEAAPDACERCGGSGHYRHFGVCYDCGGTGRTEAA